MGTGPEVIHPHHHATHRADRADVEFKQDRRLKHRVQHLQDLAADLLAGRMDRATFDQEKSRLLDDSFDPHKESASGASLKNNTALENDEYPPSSVLAPHLMGQAPIPEYTQGIIRPSTEQFNFSHHGSKTNILITLLVLLFATQLFVGLLYYQHQENGPVLEVEESVQVIPESESSEIRLEAIQTRDQLTPEIRRIFRVLIRTDQVEWTELTLAPNLRSIGYKVRVQDTPNPIHRIRWGDVPQPVVDEILAISRDSLELEEEIFDEWANDETLDHEIRLDFPANVVP